jgi:hypothetical protein
MRSLNGLDLTPAWTLELDEFLTQSAMFVLAPTLGELGIDMDLQQPEMAVSRVGFKQREP